MSGLSPTQRSLAWLRDRGYEVEIVSYWHAFSKRRVDLLGVADLLAYIPCQDGVTLVQVTDETSHAHHRVKILASEKARQWVRDPDRRLVIHSWGKRGARGETKVWQVRVEYICPDQFPK